MNVGNFFLQNREIFMAVICTSPEYILRVVRSDIDEHFRVRKSSFMFRSLSSYHAHEIKEYASLTTARRPRLDSKREKKVFV